MSSFVLLAVFVLTPGADSTVSSQNISMDNASTQEEFRAFLVSIDQRVRSVAEKAAKRRNGIENLKHIVAELNSEIQTLNKKLVHQDFVNRKFNQCLKRCLLNGDLKTTAPISKVESQTLEAEMFENVVRESKMVVDAKQNNAIFDKRGIEPEHVAFSAYLEGYPQNLRINQTGVFSGVLLNDGGAYNSYTGVFTCPRSGVYLFSVAIGDKHTDQVIVRLVVDNVLKTSVVAESIKNEHVDQGANVIILRLTKGQSVWVAIYDHGGSQIESNTPYRFATFSGVLLYI